MQTLILNKQSLSQMCNVNPSFSDKRLQNGDFMKYTDLQDLISHSSSTRAYFLSLPVSLQSALHERNEYIHTAAELHLQADIICRAGFRSSDNKTFL